MLLLIQGRYPLVSLISAFDRVQPEFVDLAVSKCVGLPMLLGITAVLLGAIVLLIYGLFLKLFVSKLKLKFVELPEILCKFLSIAFLRSRLKFAFVCLVLRLCFTLRPILIKITKR